MSRQGRPTTPGQDHLLEIMTAISIEKDLDRLLQTILSTARELTNAESGRIYILDPSGRHLVCQLVQDDRADDAVAENKPIPLYLNSRPNSRDLCAYCAFAGEPVRVDDVPASGAFEFSDRLRADQLLAHHTQSLLVAPLNRPHEFTVGVLELANALHPESSARIPFREDQERLVQAFASQAAVSINNARLHDENRRLIKVLDASNRSLEEENRKLRRRVHARCDFSEIIGSSPPMLQVFDLIEKITDTETTILISGETGVGKELIAQAIHGNGPRSARPFIAQNCAALPEHLLESELFGYRKGAFTGADRDRAGLFEAANRGTFFLDEVGDLPMSLQAKLLRVLQEGEVRPLGDVNTRAVDVRVLAATHHDLKQCVAEGTFREDLYYRLQVFPIDVPPLRERTDDLPALAQHFIDNYAEIHGKKIKGLAPAALDLLMHHSFPGNIRELRNMLERATILATDGGHITVDELPPEIRYERVGGADAKLRGSGLSDIVEVYEAKVIKERLRQMHGNRTRAAENLQISRRALQNKMTKYSLGE